MMRNTGLIIEALKLAEKAPDASKHLAVRLIMEHIPRKTKLARYLHQQFERSLHDEDQINIALREAYNLLTRSFPPSPQDVIREHPLFDEMRRIILPTVRMELLDRFRLSAVSPEDHEVLAILESAEPVYRVAVTIDGFAYQVSTCKHVMDGLEKAGRHIDAMDRNLPVTRIAYLHQAGGCLHVITKNSESFMETYNNPSTSLEDCLSLAIQAIRSLQLMHEAGIILPGVAQRTLRFGLGRVLFDVKLSSDYTPGLITPTISPPEKNTLQLLNVLACCEHKTLRNRIDYLRVREIFDPRSCAEELEYLQTIVREPGDSEYSDSEDEGDSEPVDSETKAPATNGPGTVSTQEPSSSVTSTSESLEEAQEVEQGVVVHVDDEESK